MSIKSTVIVSMERLCGEWRWRLTTLSINPSKSLVDLILPPSPVTLSKDNGQKENVNVLLECVNRISLRIAPTSTFLKFCLLEDPSYFSFT